jgi:hypothetical protein
LRRPEAAAQIRMIRPDIPVILSEGYSSASLERNAKAIGSSMYCTSRFGKPTLRGR